MFNVFIVLFLTITSFSLFSGTTKYGAIDRSFYAIGKGVVETAIVYNEKDFVFDCALLKTNVESYLTDNLTRYVKSYTLGFYFYDYVSQEICYSDTCNACKVRLKAALPLFKEYDKTLKFELTHNE